MVYFAGGVFYRETDCLYAMLEKVASRKIDTVLPEKTKGKDEENDSKR